MIIQKGILHIMDFNSDMCVMSQKELDIGDYGTGEFIDKHMERILTDSSAKKGKFLEHSIFKQTLDKYIRAEITFTDFSTAVCNLLHEQVSHADELESMDLLVCQFAGDNKSYIGFMVLPNKVAYTHQVVSGDDGVTNKIIRYYTLLPNTTQKITSYAIIDVDDYSIKFGDKKRSITGEDVFVISDKVLQCTYEQSPRETVRIIKKVTAEAAEEYGSNAAIAVTRAKNFIIENAERDVPFSPAELGEEIFRENAAIKETFKQKALDASLPSKIQVENPKVVKSVRNHKIKTDTGIEIKIPTEYLENSRYVEFVNNPDGTISIELKNIVKISNS